MAEMQGNIGTVTVSVEVDMVASEQFDRIANMLGYSKERTCRNVSEQGTLFECSECGAKTVDAVGNYTQEYCAACGARVIDE